MIFTKEDKEFYLAQREKQIIAKKKYIFEQMDDYQNIISNIPSEDDVLDNIQPKRRYNKRNDYPPHWNKSMKAKYTSYYNRCISNNKEFTLTYSQFENQFNNPCIYCNSNDNITIDRIDSSIGYTINNCQSCCNTCNKMKLDMTNNEFLDKIKAIYQYSYQSKII